MNNMIIALTLVIASHRSNTLLTIICSKFLYNHAPQYGSVMYILSSENGPGLLDVAIDSCMFSMNTALLDSAIYLVYVQSIHLSNITFTTKRKLNSIYMRLPSRKVDNYNKHIFWTNELTFEMGNTSIASSAGAKELAEMGAVLIRQDGNVNPVDQALLRLLLGQHQAVYATG